MLTGLDSRYPTDPKVESVNIGLSLLKAMVLVIFPLVAYLFLRKNREQLEIPQFRVKYSTLYHDLWVGKNTTAEYILNFTTRRMLLAMTTASINFMVLPSLYIYFYGSLFFIHKYFSLKVFDKLWVERVEIMNEVFIMISGYFSFCFTEWIGDIQTRYQVGKFYFDMILIVIILNMVAIIYEVGTDINR